MQLQPCFGDANGTAAVTSTLTVQTTGATVAALDRRTMQGSGWLPQGGAALALVLLVIPGVRRRGWLGGTALLLFAVCVAGVMGCGSSGSNGGSVQNANATPPGSYSIQVTTLAGTTSGAAPVTVSLTITQ